ncbi:hypothetical protein [Carnobacterium divergens]|uniref:hypothetical protein n=1 Tax=Carnobacterium divergens TaxID=2748 RepID=UPI0039AEA4A5
MKEGGSLIIKGVDATFKELGFSILSHEVLQTMYQGKLRCEYNLNLKVYERKLSNGVSLIVESFFEQGHSTYIYDFYKISYAYKGSSIDLKGSKMSPKQAILKVRNYINYLERKNKEHKITQEDERNEIDEKKKSVKTINDPCGDVRSIKLF